MGTTMRRLLEMIEAVNGGKIMPIEFIDWFDRFYFEMENPDVITECLMNILGNAYADFGYYEPNSAIRQESKAYFGDDRFFQILDTLKKEIERQVPPV